jgi:hypothetical protein
MTVSRLRLSVDCQGKSTLRLIHRTRFDLKGTPSHILVDKHGVLRDCAFGAYPELEARVQGLLLE